MNPRKLEPRFYEKVWGSTDLAPWFPHSERKIGEVWFTAEPPLPILIKFLFTSERLSVQVHPDDADGAAGKTEMWHILRAAPEAAIALGFRQPLTREELRRAALSGEIETLLRWWPAQAGQTFFAPARTVHSIGGGLALVEIQQQSDVTYRLYDYGRPRELHLDAALRVADLGPHPGPCAPPRDNLLVSCPHFVTESVAMEAAYPCPAGPEQAWICLTGRGCFGTEPYRAGEVFLAPRDCPDFTIRPDEASQFLRTWRP